MTEAAFDPLRTPDPRNQRLQAQWMVLIAQGGRARQGALRQLFEAYDGAVIARCMRDYRLSRQEAEDVWQEVLIKVCEHADRFDPARDVAPWLWQIVKNEALDALDLAWRKRRRDVPEEEPPEPRIPPAQEQLPHFAVDECVQRAVQELGREHPEEARAIGQRLLEEDSIAKVAARLGRSEGATRVFICGARKKLAPYLEPCLALLREKE